MTISAVRKTEFFEHFDNPQMTNYEFRKKMRVGGRTMMNMRTDYNIWRKEQDKEKKNTAKARNLLAEQIYKKPEDADLDLIQKIKEMDEAVFTAGKVNKISKMAEMWYKRHGLLIDKTETKVTLELSADERARRESEADQRAREFREGQGYRVEDVQERPHLLHNPIREDK